MPTQQMGAESRAPTTLPDIFRTINGINLDIGPLDRIRGGQGQYDSIPGGRDDAKNGAPGSCPRIVLRDALGHELDTFTALQEAIYRAKSNVKQTGQAKTPLEWRLPKAPPPARPDLTRTFPPVKHPSVPTVAEKTRSKWSHSRVMEFDVEDVGFVQESLQHLPHVPSLSFLRQEILVGPKTYFQIVGTMLLHEKVLSQTEKRQAIYNFPGFCSGCIRMGLCYGCEKGSEPHFHEDKPVRTGGGFTYFKKDRPENEMKGRNPINWKIHHPDLVLKKLMEDYAGVDLDGQIPAEIQEHLDKYGGHRVRQMPHIPDFASEMEEQRQREKREADLEILKQNGGFLPSINADGTMGEDSNNMTSRAEGRNAGQMSNRGPDGQLVNPDDVNIEMSDDRTYGTSGDPDERSDSRRQQKVIGGSESGQHDTVMVPTSQSTKKNKSRSGATDGTSQLDKSDDESRRSRSYDTYRHRLPKYRKTQSDDERNEEEEESDEEGDSMDRKRRRGRRREKLYHAPPAFKLKKSPSRRTQAKSPFSTERSFSINKGNRFQVKKSDKALTEFKDFRNVDAAWKEPKKFELKKTGNKSTKFWSGPPKSKKEEKITGNKKMKFRRVPSPRAISPDSGLDSEFMTDSNKSELEPLREETWTPSPEPPKMTTPAPPRLPTPEKPRSISPLKRKEIVRKEKKEVKPRTPPPPKPPTPVIQERSPSPETSVEEVPVSREISFDFVKEPSLPELPPIEVPELPSIVEKESDYKGIKKERKLIEVAPEIPEQKKKLPGPPKLAPRIRSRAQSRKTKVAEAPVTTQELQQLTDPLDFLAKYCIINPDRLPYYERVYNGAISVQTPRYSHDPSPPRGGAMVQLPPAQLSKHEIQMLHDLTVLNRSQVPRREGISAPEQYLEKLNYSLEFIRMKQDTLQDTMHRLQVEKMRYMAGQAKLLDRDIVRLDYKTKGKKKKENSSKKKKKKKKAENIDYDMMGAMTVDMRNFKPSKAADITDEVIVSRMDDKMMKKVKKDPIVKQFNLELNRLVEKLTHFDERTAQIEDEKDLVGLYCMDYYFSEQVNASRPYEFRRQQSRLYQKLHPDQDVEMNIDEVETALQQINNKLLTEKEFQYIYFILDLPKREKINFRLFSIIAALSEKVTQMDPVIRKLLNKVDYNALDIKMEKSKELFELLQDEVHLPMGNAPTSTLALELTAGGLTPEHTSYVLSKFNREGKGFIDFLDFVTYVPLFIDIHKRIIADPFNESLDI